MGAALFLFLSYLTLSSSCCSATDSIKTQQSLKYPSTIMSKNKTFTLGFFVPPNSTNRYVGIWYSNPSVRNVVWVANYDNPLHDSSGVLTISKDGNLQLLNGANQILWSSNVTSQRGNTNLTAQLLESGNLVLISNGDVIWQSLDHPTDTLLPNLKYTSSNISVLRKVLKSWRSPSDPSEGQFTAGLDTFTLPQLVVWDKDRLHWRSGPWNGNIFIGVQFNFIDFINAQLVISSDKQGTITVTYLYPNKSLLSTYKLSTEGKMSQTWWDDKKRSWEIEWQEPERECDLYGRCGAFGTCNSQRPVICECLKGFEPHNKERWNKGEWSDGCVRRKKLDCQNGNSNEDGFLRLKMMKVPDHAEWRLGLNQEGCRKQCLSNCSCLAFAYDTGVGCMTWGTKLVDIQEFSVGGVDLYLRLAHSELGNNNKVTVITAVVGTTLGAAVIAFLLCLLWKQRTHQQACNKKKEQVVHTSSNEERKVDLEELPLFSFETLAEATNNFSERNKLGRGGFGTVYKGKLENGQEIAVKRLSRDSGQGIEEFMNEAMVISKLQHRNLVKLHGCSVEEGEKILVYEYMPNKSLDTFIFAREKQNTLDWTKRFNIIKGICRGLQYLHHDSRLKIIHRDLKASNILLDKELDPKISDFGMARIFKWEQDQADTKRVVGTYGYMSPEYAMEGIVSEKSDVFSFGVLLLELISGKRNSIFSDNERSLTLLGYAWKLWNEKNVTTSLIDPSIAQPDNEEEILRCVHVGLLCVQELARDRPNITVVISMLNGEVSDLPHPNRPGFASMSKMATSSQENQEDLSTNYVSITDVSGR